MPTAAKKYSMTKAAYVPDSDDLVWLDLNPRTGHEQSGRRPCLVLSSRLFAERTGMAIICPTTSNLKGLPFEIPLSGTKTAGAILPIHVRSIDLEARYPKFIEKAPAKIAQQVRDYVRIIIGDSTV